MDSSFLLYLLLCGYFCMLGTCNPEATLVFVGFKLNLVARSPPSPPFRAALGYELGWLCRGLYNVFRWHCLLCYCPQLLGGLSVFLNMLSS